MLDKDSHFVSLSIVDREGTVIASSLEEIIGTSLSEDDLFGTALESTQVSDLRLSPVSGRPVLAISVPVSVDGRFLGEVLQELSLENLYAMLTDHTGLRETCETYLVNREGELISPSRFASGMALKGKIVSENFARCRLHRDGATTPPCTDIGVFKDYRGVEVLGTHHYIPQMGWALLAEIDAEEALAPLRKLRAMAACFLVAVPLVALLIGGYVSRMITGPIKKLREGAGIIGKGDLTYRVNATSGDEIGELGRAFDEMTEGLGRATTTIDRLNEEIRERQNAQMALVRLERLNALEEMAAGVSHNLNNMLVGVLGHAQLLENATDDPTVADGARAIVKSARRAEDLVDRLTLAIRGDNLEVGPVDASELAQEVASATLKRLRADVAGGGKDVCIHVDSGYVPMVCAGRSGVVQILNNLIQNSLEAMRGGGNIRVSLKESCGFVNMTVSDDGVGMDRSVQARVFEPLFTTKAEIGKGLGLSSVYGMVTRWGGQVNIDSEPGRGCAVTVSLPMWRRIRSVESERSGAPASETDDWWNGRVLIVDDERIVTSTLHDCLESLYDITIARSGLEALEVMKDVDFDVAIIDLGLPGMPGDMLSVRLRDQSPGLVTILMTGWDIGKGDPNVENFDLWIRKPFKNLDRVKEVLAQAMNLHDKRASDSAAA